MSVKDNLLEINERIKESAAVFGHQQGEISLVAVSKMVDEKLVKEAMAEGLTTFGENRVQEIKRKRDLFKDCELHMIGRLQSNKVRDLLDVSLIQSIDRKSLLKEMERIGKREDHLFHGLIQVNIVGEEQKGGIHPGNLIEILDYVESLEHVRIEGLMNIGPFTEDEHELRCSFREMRKLFDSAQKIMYNNTKMRILSMGMSHDYQIALEEGSTMVRIGSAIFGKRSYQ